MSSKILVINAGSSSIKFQIFEYKNLELITKGSCERIGIDGIFNISLKGKKNKISCNIQNHAIAIDYILEYLISKKIINNQNEIIGIGNRLVHGGEIFNSTTIINNDVIKKLKSISDLAPIHLPHQINCINELVKKFKEAKHFAIFDTEFHQNLPLENHMYGIKYDWYKKYNIRKYGFHGISYNYLTNKMCKIKNKKKVSMIACHLGNGSSICAIKDNISINTSMGFSVIDGLVMSNRVGDISISVVDYIAKKEKISHEKVIDILTKESGLLGICGYSDMREIQNNMNDKKVKIAFNLFVKKVSDYISIYLNDLGKKIDAIVFAGGIGENSSFVIESIINKIKIANIKISKYNFLDNEDYLKISKKDSEIDIYVIKTNEEIIIAKEVIKGLKNETR